MLLFSGLGAGKPETGCKAPYGHDIFRFCGDLCYLAGWSWNSFISPGPPAVVSIGHCRFESWVATELRCKDPYGPDLKSVVGPTLAFWTVKGPYGVELSSWRWCLQQWTLTAMI